VSKAASSYQKLGTNYLVSILDCSRLDNGYPHSRVRRKVRFVGKTSVKFASKAASSYQKLGTNYLVSILDCSRLDNGYPHSRVRRKVRFASKTKG
jgi:hypothetical protein